MHPQKRLRDQIQTLKGGYCMVNLQNCPKVLADAPYAGGAKLATNPNPAQGFHIVL